jgi:EAL domain-containing protein (putative c-di-GMP-specific phosphodiesterase class I)
MGRLPATIGAIVHAAIATERARDLDAFIVRIILERIGQLVETAAVDPVTAHFAINVTPATLLDDRFDPRAFAEEVRDHHLAPRSITLECTEQQAVSDPTSLRKRVTALRRLGFGFAVDDAGAGYASFSLIAALRPSIIKIDREIVHRIGRDDAKQALVEAFVSFARRIDARLVAEGIENRADLRTLTELGVELGQGYLLGRPAPQPGRPRPIIPRLDGAAAGLLARVRPDRSEWRSARTGPDSPAPAPRRARAARRRPTRSPASLAR